MCVYSVYVQLLTNVFVPKNTNIQPEINEYRKNRKQTGCAANHLLRPAQTERK